MPCCRAAYVAVLSMTLGLGLASGGVAQVITESDGSVTTSAERRAAAIARARATEQQMTDDERFSLLVSLIGPAPSIGYPRDKRIPASVKNLSAGYTPGVPRLGIPALQSSDAGAGVTNPGYRPDDRGATAFPSSIVVGSSFNPQLAREGGAAIAREARSRGFNIQLAGGINLTRDVRNGRNFEYYGEDPYHSAVLGAAQVNGIQGQRVISTLEHFVLNGSEANRYWLDAIIDPAALRESDMLAFQIAIERSSPGAIMTSHNKVNGVYTSGNEFLLTDVLKEAWGFEGYVMSDWGATPDWRFALAGLDQESGLQSDVKQWGAEAFTDSLRAAHRTGRFPRERLSDMVCRILGSVYAIGIDEHGRPPAVDTARHNEIALEIARQGIVLLKNDGALPLATEQPLKIAVIGGYAQLGVVSGTGSGAVSPVGGYAARINIGGPGNLGGTRDLFLYGPSPLAELKAALPNAEIEFSPADTPAEAALAARRSDLVIAFGVRVEGEGFDIADLSLPWGQDAIIEAVATANRNTIVVLETGNPVSMPWRDRVAAIVEAWYPGQAGAQALAEILTGRTNPSGRLPVTFPVDLAQTPRPEFPGLGVPQRTPVTIRYDEGAEVGYRWFAKQHTKPMYAFGHGLSYTTFAYRDFTVSAGGDTTVVATLTVTNTGQRNGADVPQIYLTSAAGEQRTRLLGFERVSLRPGESRRVTITADPRLLARFDGPSGLGHWRVDAGAYEVSLARAADDVVETKIVTLPARTFGR